MLNEIVAEAVADEMMKNYRTFCIRTLCLLSEHLCAIGTHRTAKQLVKLVLLL